MVSYRKCALLIGPVLLMLFLHMFCRADQAKQPTSATPDFDRAIVPVLVEHCIACHSGPRPKGGLDLTRKQAVLKGGKSGKALVPGKPGNSLLWERVKAGEMPPKKPLGEAEKKLLRTWIEGGAAWGSDPIDPFRFTTSKRAGLDWWSLQAVKRPTLPAVKNTDWSRNAIDRFVLSRLEQRGLKPSAEADRRTLIRRLSFDLIGMPPTPTDVEAFVRDKNPNAHERLVDRLLASPHYGERWARHWLDVVRFGESDGFERNGSRANAWQYRDWVIRALNGDMPYDEYCRLQIAGDVLQPDDVEALKATGYLVAGIHNTVVPMNKTAQEIARQDELEDLVGNVGQTFLGLTVNCGRCHDHKFDPIAQKDYYRVASALSGVAHGERSILAGASKSKLDLLDAERKKLETQLAAIEEPARQALLADKKAGKFKELSPPRPIAAWDFRNRDLKIQLIGNARLTPEGLVVDGKDSFARSTPLPFALGEKTLEAWVRLENLTQSGGGILSVQTQDGGVFDAIVYGEKEPAQWMAGSNGFVRTQSFHAPKELEASRQPVHLAITYHKDATITGYRNGKPYGRPYRSNGPQKFAAGKAVVAFGIRHEPAGGNHMLAGVIIQARLYDRALSASEIAASAALGDIITEADVLARLKASERKQRADVLARLTDLSAQRSRLQNQVTMKVYAALSQQPQPTRLLNRGQVTDAGELVAPGGIPALADLRADFGLAVTAPEAERRKKLADWMTHQDNPLFARVLVNRMWHYHFGTGIVETPNDFGFNGGRPSHRELLDWLASEFVARGYRLKDMHRLIVTSSTYRQASMPRKAELAADAESRLLWRKKPLRMEGEVLRDSMLAVAGLLNPVVGGKGFSDYKEHGNAGTTYYDPFDPVGHAFHRRSIYRFSPRGGNQGLLDAFDCPDPAAAAPRRSATTTPLQALALWNGGFALRMAEAFATRLKSEAGAELDRQVDLAYRLTFQREPLPVERDLARRLVEQHGLATLCRALFNANEFLTVD